MSATSQLGRHHPRVVAVVPLFEPASAAARGIRLLAEQVDGVVLVDDGSPTDVMAFVESLRLPGVQLVRSPENRGIASALNLGIASAIRESAEFVLTADQDSVFDADYVRQLLAVVASLESDGVPFACVAAGVVNGKPNPSRPHPATSFRVTVETIQSGLLFPTAVLEQLGPFDESLFIDCVDTDYILRGAAHGLPTFLGPDCRMEHALGEGIAVRLPAAFRRRERVVPYHSPLRRYYITRNRIRLLGRHARQNPRWMVVQTYEQMKSIVADLMWGPDRRGSVLAVAHGVMDGVRGRGGRIPSRVESVLRSRSRGRVRRPGPIRMV